MPNLKTALLALQDLIAACGSASHPQGHHVRAPNQINILGWLRVGAVDWVAVLHDTNLPWTERCFRLAERDLALASDAMCVVTAMETYREIVRNPDTLIPRLAS